MKKGLKVILLIIAALLTIGLVGKATVKTEDLPEFFKTDNSVIENVKIAVEENEEPKRVDWIKDLETNNCTDFLDRYEIISDSKILPGNYEYSRLTVNNVASTYSGDPLTLGDPIKEKITYDEDIIADFTKITILENNTSKNEYETLAQNVIGRLYIIDSEYQKVLYCSDNTSMYSSGSWSDGGYDYFNDGSYIFTCNGKLYIYEYKLDSAGDNMSTCGGGGYKFKNDIENSTLTQYTTFSEFMEHVQVYQMNKLDTDETPTYANTITLATSQE